MLRKLSNVKPGDPILADDENAIRERLRELGRLPGEPPHLPPKLAKVKSYTGAGALYNMYEIDKDGVTLAGAPEFQAYEADGVATVGVDARVLVVGGGGPDYWVFFRPRGIVAFDGVCRIDEAVPAGVDPNTNAAMVANTAGGAGVLVPDAGTMEYLLLHLAQPVVTKISHRVFLQFTRLRINWDMDDQSWGDLRYSFNLDWITQDFDYDNDGDPLPARNTWATRPTVVAGTTFRVDVLMTDCEEVRYDLYSLCVPAYSASPPAATTIYGVQITPVNWWEGAIGRIFDQTMTEFQVGAAGAESYYLLR